MKLHYILFSLLLGLLLLSGCGKEQSEGLPEDTPAADWQTNGFSVSGGVIEEQGLWVESHIPWKHEGVKVDPKTEAVDEINPDAVYFDGKLYMLRLIMELPQAAPSRGILEIYDTSAMEETFVELTREQMGIRTTASFVVDMDVGRDGDYVFQVVDYGFNEAHQLVQKYNGMTYLGSDGNVQQTDMLPIYLEKGISEEVYFSIERSGECTCDGFGNFYVRAGDASNPYRKLFILDRDGKLLMEQEVTEQEQFGSPMKTAEGELIFPIWNNAAKSTRLVWFDVASGNEKTLAVLEGEILMQLYGMQGNDLYYRDYNGIVKWDIESGVRKHVFVFKENGVSNVYNTMLLLRDGQSPVLRTYESINGEEEDWLVVLSEEPMERPDAIRVVGLVGHDTRVKNCVAIAGRRNPDYIYEYKDTAGRNVEDYRSQIIAEMVAGGGPDLLFVSREDMELLHQRGLLGDLRSYIKEETLSQVLPGAIEIGTLDGNLVGMPSDVTAWSLLIGESVWSGDSWTWEDVLDLMESGKLENRLNDGGGLHASRIAMMILLRYSLEDSFLIDWENGESHFEDERFIRILENMGKYELEELEDLGSARAKGGGSLMTTGALISFSGLNRFWGTWGAEGSHYVGFPTEHGSGSYLDAYGVLVVNKNVSDPEAVSAYLECLLGKEVQDIDDDGTCLPVIPISTDDIWYDKETGEVRFHGFILPVFPDGTTAIQEANAFIERCVPAPRTYEDLERIITEEVGAFYAGDKSAKEVAKVIDNKIQLYLDERN